MSATQKRQENFYRHDERKFEIYQSNAKADFKQDRKSFPATTVEPIINNEGNFIGGHVGKPSNPPMLARTIMPVGLLGCACAIGVPVGHGGKPLNLTRRAPVAGGAIISACVAGTTATDFMIDAVKETNPLKTIGNFVKKHFDSFKTSVTERIGRYVEPLPADDGISAQINRLKQIITFEDDADKELAKMNFAPMLVPLLSNALEQLKKIFPTDTEYSLCKSPDPSDRGFVLDVWAHDDTKKIMADMRKFRKDWWLDNMPDSADLLIIGAHRR